MTQVLQGIRVVDWGIVYQGPLASMMLADLGADVIKVEARVSGDPVRGFVGTGGKSFGLPAGAIPLWSHTTETSGV